MSMYGIGREASIFLCACLSGIVVAVIYQILTVFRSVVKHSYAASNVEDFFYWIGTGIYLFYQMYSTTYGIVRWYFILGVMLGFFASKVLISQIAKGLTKIQKKLEKSGKNK